MIAELFTALYMGIELPEQLYNWYIDHGGPKFYDTPIIYSDVPPNAPQ